MRRWSLAAATVLATAAVTTGLGAGVAPAAARVSVSATIDGQSVGTSSQGRPVTLHARQNSILAVTVTNPGPAPVDIQEVRLEGRVVGLTFFAYDTAVSMPVGPGSRTSQRLTLDLSGLDGQATGLIPAAVQVLDGQHHMVAEQSGVADVRGSLRSVYGLFGLGVAFLTVLSLLGALLGLARHRLPEDRWRRALRFLTPGLGLGLVVDFTLSALRIFVPRAGRWTVITALCALAFFGAGYLTPNPDRDEEGRVGVPAGPADLATAAVAGRGTSPGPATTRDAWAAETRAPGRPMSQPGGSPADGGATGAPHPASEPDAAARTRVRPATPARPDARPAAPARADARPAAPAPAPAPAAAGRVPESHPTRPPTPPPDPSAVMRPPPLFPSVIPPLPRLFTEPPPAADPARPAGADTRATLPAGSSPTVRSPLPPAPPNSSPSRPEDPADSSDPANGR